jgi:hypothetical protein
MRTEIALENNRYAHIDMFVQWRTYKGLLEGVPNRSINNWYIECAKNDAVRFCGNVPVYLIEPKQKIHREDRLHPENTVMSLPEVTCIAELNSYKPVKDPDMVGSKLIVVWYQDTMAMPIDEAILDQMKLINWSELAEDYGD